MGMESTLISPELFVYPQMTAYSWNLFDFIAGESERVSQEQFIVL